MKDITNLGISVLAIVFIVLVVALAAYPPHPNYSDLTGKATAALRTAPELAAEEEKVVEGEAVVEEVKFVEEKVVFVFHGSVSDQKAYSDAGYCGGVDSCFVAVSGVAGEKVVWESSCGGEDYTVIDGVSEQVVFECEETPQPQPEPVLETPPQDIPEPVPNILPLEELVPEQPIPISFSIAGTSLSCFAGTKVYYGDSYKEIPCNSQTMVSVVNFLHNGGIPDSAIFNMINSNMKPSFKYVEGSGYKLDITLQPPYFLSFSGSLEDLRGADEIYHLSLSGLYGVSGDIRNLVHLSGLEYLNLMSCSVSGSIGVLSALENLDELYLSGNVNLGGNINELANIGNIRRLSLDYIDVEGNFEDLAGLEFETLSLQSTNMFLENSNEPSAIYYFVANVDADYFLSNDFDSDAQPLCFCENLNSDDREAVEDKCALLGKYCEYIVPEYRGLCQDIPEIIYEEAKGYEDVLVIMNENSDESKEIGYYFAGKRGIPEENLFFLSTSTQEEISRPDFNSQILAPVKSRVQELISSGTNINYIVLTKGIPLRIARTGLDWKNIASVDSELTLINGQHEPAIGWTDAVDNPYYGKYQPFFNQKYGIFLVTRLDGYTVGDVKALIDRSERAGQSENVIGTVLIDNSPNMFFQELQDAGGALESIGFPEDNIIYDETPYYYQEMPSSIPLLGYASAGQNDRTARFNHLRDHDFIFVDGALATMYSSFFGRTMKEPPEDWTIGDWEYIPFVVEDQPNTDDIRYLKFRFGDNSNPTAIHEIDVYTKEMGAQFDVADITSGASISSANSFSPAWPLQNMIIGQSTNQNSPIYGAPPAFFTDIQQNKEVVVDLAQHYDLTLIKVSRIRQGANTQIEYIEVYSSQNGAEWSLIGAEYDPYQYYFEGSPQDVMGDFIRAGITGVSGSVFEPYSSGITNPAIFFPNYFRGRNLAESFYSSLYRLSWMSVVIGDPKTKIAVGLEG